MMLKKYAAFILFFVAVVWLIAPAFETIDDSFMVQIVSGKYGHHPSEMMLYSSPIYGKVLVLLYRLLPSFNWYFFIFLMAHLVSWLVILDLLLKYNTGKQRLSILLFVMLFTTFGLYFLGNLQFTTTAFILASSGLLLIINNKKNVAIVIGVIMILLAFLIRLYGVLFLGCLVLPYFLYKWVLCDGFLNIREHKKSILIIFGLGIMMLLIIQTGRMIYQQSDSGKTLRSYIIAKGNLIDNPNFVYTSANFNVFKEVGWTEEDFKIFSGYYFDQSIPFNPERLVNIRHHLGIVKPDQSRLRKGLEKVFLQYQVYVLFLLLIISAVLFTRFEKKDLLFAVLQSVAILVFLTYILFFNDFKLRVVIPLFYIASLFIVMYILRDRSFEQYSVGKSLRWINYGIIIFIALAIYNNYVASMDRRNNDNVLKRQIALINDIEKEWLVVQGYDLPIEHATLNLLNNGTDLKGKVYFTMASCFTHYLTGSKRDEKHLSVFDLLCNGQQTILLLHNGKTFDIAGLLNYSSNKTMQSAPGYSRIVNPGIIYDLYMLANQNRN